MRRLFTALVILAAVAPAGGITFPDVPYGRVSTSGDYLLVFTMGLSNRFFMLNRDGEILFDTAGSGLDYNAFVDGAVTPDGRHLVLRVDDATISFILVIGPDGSRREYKYDDGCGPPVWDVEGNLWYAVGEELYRNHEPSGLRVEDEYISISADGRFAAYADVAGALYRLELDTGAKEVVASGKAFFPPRYATTGQIIVGCWEKEIWVFEPGGEGEMVAEGIHPAWCAETEAVLFAVPSPESEGEYIPAAEIWRYDRTGTLWQMTDTPEVAETWPVSWRGDIVAVDSLTNELIYIKQEW